MNYVVTFKNVRREAFDAVSDLCMPSTGDPTFAGKVIVEYHGTHIRGDMHIEVHSSNQEIYNELLKRVAEIVPKY